MNNTLFVGNVRLEFDELISTNDYLSELLAKSNPPEGMLIIAAKQSKGKGQVGSSWFTGTGDNLALSFLFRPKFVHPSLQFLLSQTFALGVLDALLPYSTCGFSIKWPNDIYYKNKKIAGMLLENSIQGGRFSQSIWGLGLNVNQEVFPVELPNALSLYQIFQKKIDKKMLVETLCHTIERRYLALRQGRQAQIESDYLAYLYKREVLTTFRNQKTMEVFEARPIGVNEYGHLIVEKSDGNREAFGLKELFWV